MRSSLATVNYHRKKTIAGITTSSVLTDFCKRTFLTSDPLDEPNTIYIPGLKSN